MSKQYPGGIISKTAPVPSGPYSDSTAPGIWTLDQQAAYAKQGQWPTAGNANPSLFIENLFSTFVYGGNSSTQTITNGIDLSTKSGMVWGKMRNSSGNNWVMDTIRGINSSLVTQTNGVAIDPAGAYISSFNTTGFSLGSNITVNGSTYTYASWTFREQPKFFDIVTYTGNGTTQNIAHNLGSVPGAILVKCTTIARDWAVYHRSLGGTKFLKLNAIDGAATASSLWNDTDPTSTVFTVGSDQDTNSNGATYVAYIYAHNAGGFGLSGSENVITCGSSSTNSSGNDIVDLGFEPQWVMIKPVGAGGGNWQIRDVMRVFSRIQNSGASLFPNRSDAETASSTFWMEDSTGGSNGFRLASSFTSQDYIYIVIRRGPMAAPTTGTSVFSVDTYNQTSATDPAFNLGSVTDLGLRRLSDFASSWTTQTRLTNNQGLTTNTSDAESTFNFGFWDNMVGWYQGGAITPPYSQANWYGWNFKRAPGFMDVVCYTGTLANRTVPHNLGVAPEMMIVKCRSSSAPGGIAANWAVYAAPQGNDKFALLNTTDLFGTSAVLWQATTPTASNFSIGAANYVNGSGETYIAYLFASVAGVSKVGTYTGTGALLTVNCGFTSGARFVLIKRADTSGDWWTYDSVRGITSGNDPYLFMNSSDVQVTGTNYVDTTAVGFQVTAAAPAGLNASGGVYIFLAIA